MENEAKKWGKNGSGKNSDVRRQFGPGRVNIALRPHWFVVTKLPLFLKVLLVSHLDRNFRGRRLQIPET